MSSSDLKLIQELCISSPVLLDTGTYADDCLVNRVTVNKCYIVATVSPTRIHFPPTTFEARFADGSYRMMLGEISAIEI